MSNPTPALILFAVTIGAAWSLPRFRSWLGLSGELVALTALLTMRGAAILPEAWFPGRTVELVVLCYAFVRIQRLWATAPDPVEASAPTRWYDRVAATKNAHLLAFSAYVIGWSAIGDPLVKWSSLAMPLLMGLAALDSRRLALFVVPLPFLGGVAYLAITGG